MSLQRFIRYCVLETHNIKDQVLSELIRDRMVEFADKRIFADGKLIQVNATPEEVRAEIEKIERQYNDALSVFQAFGLIDQAYNNTQRWMR